MTPELDTRGLELRDQLREEQILEQRLRVPADLPCLEGHFPGLPVLPGLAQLRWAVEAAAFLRGAPFVPTRIEALKFRELLRPGEEFVARAELSSDGLVVRFSVEREGRVVATCRLRRGPEAESLGSVAPCEQETDAIAAAELLPHSGPMVFLDRLLAADEKRTVCGVRIDDLPLFRSADGSLPAWAGVEAMAQTIAAHGGLEARRRGEAAKVGFLLGCRRLEIRADRLQPGVGYAAAATQVWGGERGLVSFDCELFERQGGRRLLAGRINAYLPEDLDALLEGRLG
jgi:predicted hotdog family 3-hydroxylacyl-ACP dehydratase